MPTYAHQIARQRAQRVPGRYAHGRPAPVESRAAAVLDRPRVAGSFDLATGELRMVDMDLRPSRNGRTLDGYVAVFNRRARIPDKGGDFEELLLPGFADRSLRENGMPLMMWDHGRDPRVGTVPIGKWESWAADGHGYRVRGDLFDNPVVEPVRQAVAAGAVNGLSFRFKARKDRWDRRKGSDGMDLRSVIDADVHEGGPVAFPAYADAKVAIRAVDLADVPILRSYADDRRADLEYLDARTVTGYLCTWAATTRQRNDRGEEVRTRIAQAAGEDWCRRWPAAGYPQIPVKVNHEGRSVGVLTDAWADEFGLYVTVAADDDALRAVEAGDLRGFSIGAVDTQTRVADDGVVEVGRFELREVTLADYPRDIAACFDTVAGRGVEPRSAEFADVGHWLSWAEDHTGIRTADALASAERQQAEAVRTRLWDIATFAAEVAEHRAAALAAYGSWSRSHRGHDMGQALDADRAEARSLEALREAAMLDRDLVDRALEAAGAPEYISPFRATARALAGPVDEARVSDHYYRSMLERRAEQRELYGVTGAAA